MAEGPDGRGSFLRGLGVLMAVAELGEARADEIAAELSVPLSTVYRYLRMLRELDLIEERDGSYVPGWSWRGRTSRAPVWWSWATRSCAS